MLHKDVSHVRVALLQAPQRLNIALGWPIKASRDVLCLVGPYAPVMLCVPAIDGS